MMSSSLMHREISRDGTIKLLVELQDGLRVEAVIMQYDTSTRCGQASRLGLEKDDGYDAAEDRCYARNVRDGVEGGKRATLCVSSEVGCQMGCTFCATGTMGLSGDLTAAEIVEQLVHAKRFQSIRNVVFMVSIFAYESSMHVGRERMRDTWFLR